MGRAFEFRKARKLKRWGNMAKTFTKLGKEITIAAKAGGGDPHTNPRLRLLIQNAKSANMPKENVDRAIKKATEKDLKEYKEMVYEGKGPYGIAILVETATDNPTRTVANVRTCFNKYNGSLGTSGMLDYLFERKCSFKVEKKEGIDMEELEFELIDYGAEDVFEEDQFIMIYAEFTSFGPIQKYLEEKSFVISTFEFERIPTELKEVTPEQQAEVDKILEKLEEDEDVTNVFHNMKVKE